MDSPENSESPEKSELPERSDSQEQSESAAPPGNHDIKQCKAEDCNGFYTCHADSTMLMKFVKKYYSTINELCQSCKDDSEHFISNDVFTFTKHCCRRPYRCAYCNYHFKHRSFLDDHYKTENHLIKRRDVLAVDLNSPMETKSDEGEYGHGTLLCDPIKLSNGRVYNIWKPKDLYDVSSSDVERCNLPEYKDFDSLSHVDHFEDYAKNKKNESFHPNEVTYWSNSHLFYKHKLGHKPKIVWLGPRQDPHKHNFYGNVSSNITMSSFMKCMENLSLNLYFVEIVDFKCASASRFIFTYKKYETLTLYNPKKKGGAWCENNGQHYLLTSLKRWEPSEGNKCLDHEFEIMLELGDADYHKLFKLLDTEAVDHSEAQDTLQGKRCKKSLGSPIKCSSNWSKSDTEKQMKIFEHKYAQKSNNKRILGEDSDSEKESNPDLCRKQIKL